MRVHNVIIMTAGSRDLSQNGESGDSLDHLIRRVFRLKKNPILVIGPEGDDVLRNSELTEECELVFDPNYEGGLFSSIKAGLYAATSPAFVVPLHSTMDPQAATKALMDQDTTWQKFESVLDHKEIARNCDVLRPLTRNDKASWMNFPQVITPSGVQRLLALEAATDWNSSDQIIAGWVPVVSTTTS